MVDAVMHELGYCPPPKSARGSAPTPTRLQSKITEFFTAINQPSKPVPATRVTFLHLPSHIRQRIYSNAGFGDKHFINLNLWTGKHPDERCHDKNGLEISADDELGGDRFVSGSSPCSKKPSINMILPVALLRAGSRIIHDEVETKLYAENKFAVSLEGSHGLWALEKLSDAALRELRVLIVSMCPCRCITPYCSKTDLHLRDLPSDAPGHEDYWTSVYHLMGNVPHSRSLGCISRTDKGILAQWDRICARLAVNTRPNQLSLYLVANAADEKTARALLIPLYRMPKLGDCAIALGFHLHSLGGLEPRLFVRDVVQKLTGNTQEEPFRFLDLPFELQIKVLQYTSLVAITHVRWTPEAHFNPSDFQRNCWEKEEFARSYCNPQEKRMPPDFFNDPSPSVFCSLVNCSSFSRRCECRKSPIEYFRVSKGFSDAARHFFYGKNTFHLYPSCSSLGAIVGNWNHLYQLTLPSFLRAIPDEHIWRLRNLCIIFPPFLHDYLLPDQREWHEWVGSIDFLAQLANLPGLKLEVHFSQQTPLPGSYVTAEEDRLNILYDRARRHRDPEAEQAMLASYVRILEPLRRLGSDLLALRVYVSWPMGLEAHDQRKNDEKKLERMIMGEEYDAEKWGKSETSNYSQPKLERESDY